MGARLLQEAGRQLARPRVDQMRANNNTSLEFSGQNQGRWSRNGGNPELRPWEANAYDISIEKYFAERGYNLATVLREAQYAANNTRSLGLAPTEAAHRAHIVAGAVVQHRGAIIPKDAIPDVFASEIARRR